jgi:hypothetical protein
MKKTLITAAISAAFFASIISCKKSEDKTTPTPTPSSPYYFEFTLGGKYTKFANPEPQYAYMLGEVGGFQTPSASAIYPSIELSFIFNHRATDADVKGLAGKRLRFNDWYSTDSATAFLHYMSDASTDGLYDNDDTTYAYYVDVSKVNFLRVDTLFGTPLDIYEVTGTCRALMTDDENIEMLLEGGKFNMQISRVKN